MLISHDASVTSPDQSASSDFSLPPTSSYPPETVLDASEAAAKKAATIGSSQLAQHGSIVTTGKTGAPLRGETVGVESSSPWTEAATATGEEEPSLKPSNETSPNFLLREQLRRRSTHLGIVQDTQAKYARNLNDRLRFRLLAIEAELASISTVVEGIVALDGIAEGPLRAQSIERLYSASKSTAMNFAGSGQARKRARRAAGRLNVRHVRQSVLHTLGQLRIELNAIRAEVMSTSTPTPPPSESSSKPAKWLTSVAVKNTAAPVLTSAAEAYSAESPRSAEALPSQLSPAPFNVGRTVEGQQKGSPGGKLSHGASKDSTAPNSDSGQSLDKTELEKAIRDWAVLERESLPEWPQLSPVRRSVLRQELCRPAENGAVKRSRLERWAASILEDGSIRSDTRRGSSAVLGNTLAETQFLEKMYARVRKAKSGRSSFAKWHALEVASRWSLTLAAPPPSPPENYGVPPHLQPEFLSTLKDGSVNVAVERVEVDESRTSPKLVARTSVELARQMYPRCPTSEMAQLACLETYSPPDPTPAQPVEESHNDPTFPSCMSSAFPVSSITPEGPPVPVATLAHGLERVLFNPGVHFLRDPRTGVYNFPPILEKLPTVDQFQFEKLPKYITSSQDPKLQEYAEKYGKRFVGSTSSTTGMLCQIYFWLSGRKPINLSMLSEIWQSETPEFGMGQRLPASVILHFRDNSHYAIDADKSMDAGIDTNILASYGHLMEKLLTSEPEVFQGFLVGSENPAPSQIDEPQAYYYTQTESMILRSQLDAQHDLLPNRTFDVKTRGTAAIRQDRLNYVVGAGYDITKLKGEYGSFEREYFDLIRSAFLKYQFQARIGNMDGVLVAFHTTQAFCGFSYVPIEEMDEALFGSPHNTRQLGDRYFTSCLAFLELILKTSAECYPNRSVKLTFDATLAKSPTTPLSIFVQPVEDDPSVPAMTLIELHSRHPTEHTAKDASCRWRERTDAESWNIEYSLRTYTGVQSIEDPAAPSVEDIVRRFWETRKVQQTFSSLALPDDVKLSSVLHAQRQAAAAIRDGDTTPLDPSDLASRFPDISGLTYRNSVSRNVRRYRDLAVKGGQRKREQESAEQQQPIVEVKSRLAMSERP